MPDRVVDLVPLPIELLAQFTIHEEPQPVPAPLLLHRDGDHVHVVQMLATGNVCAGGGVPVRRAALRRGDAKRRLGALRPRLEVMLLGCLRHWFLQKS